MRSALLCLTLLGASLSLTAQSDSNPYGNNRAPVPVRVKLEIEADTIAMPLTITLKGKNRQALDQRLDEIQKVLEKRFENQDGWEVREVSREFARPDYRNKVSSGRSGSVLLGDNDEDNKADSFTLTATWSLRVASDKGVKGLEILRAKGTDLVKPKTDDEKESLGQPEYVINNPEDYRNDLLDQIKGDFEEIKKHLPEGQYSLELNSLNQAIEVSHRSGKLYWVWLPYRIVFVTPKPEKAQK
jgi:hypothetical protein